MEQFNLDTVKRLIEANHLCYGENFAKGDTTQFANHYASDACIFPTHFSKMCGIDAINAFFDGAYKMGVRYIKLTANEVMGGPDAVVETGNYKLLAANDIVVDEGKFIVIWKQEKGEWKMYRDIWNTDNPAKPTN